MNNSQNCEVSNILTKYKLNYIIDKLYYLAGGEVSPNDRIVYISIVVSQIEHLLEILIPTVRDKNLKMHVVRRLDIAEMVLNGAFGYQNIGKVIILYIPQILDFKIIVEELVNITSGFNGPSVPDYLSLGGCIYTETNTKDSSSKKPKFEIQFLKNKYLVIENLKPHVRGAVLKAIFFKNLLFPTRVIIKVAKKFMWSDEAGRDMKDRLEWQHNIHNKLFRQINVPKILDSFCEGEDQYLVMEFIKGRTLDDRIDKCYANKTWLQLSTRERLRLLKLLMGVLDMVETLHANGYIHRDLTPANFLIQNSSRIYMIDLELAYSEEIEYPFPVFKFGTPGFMSPEQKMLERPTNQEDIYALGGLMIYFFTHLTPLKFDLNDMKHISKNIFFFTKELRLSNLITQCLSEVPTKRPKISEIKDVVLSLIAATQIENPNFNIPCAPNVFQLSSTINAALKGLTIPELVANNMLFYSLGSIDFRITNVRTRTNHSGGISSPLSGILFLMHKMSKRSFNAEIYKFFRDYVLHNKDVFLNIDRIHSEGLLNGTAGKAVAINMGIELEILDKDEETCKKIEKCFEKTSNTVDLANGVAGQLLSALMIYNNIPSPYFLQKIEFYVEILLTSQNHNGSWNNTTLKKAKSKLLNGIVEGVAGIVLTLIEHCKRFNDDRVKNSLIKGLNWLKKSRYNLSFNHSESIISQSFSSGTSGIALAFLHAYEYLKITEYKTYAELLLSRLQPYQLFLNYNLWDGLAGIGMVYCEAARICKTREWIERATWIYHIISNSGQAYSENITCWNISGKEERDASLLTGTSGLILYMIHFSNLEFHQTN